jgi:hypothetical protein
LVRLEGEQWRRLQEVAEQEQALAGLCEQIGWVEKRAEDARTKGREELVEVQRQIAGWEESNRLLVQRIAAGKAAVETRDTEEEKARMKVVDGRKDGKVEMEWVDSDCSQCEA